MNGKLIVIDGTDGSGKTTQADILYKKLKNRYDKVLLISFPNYDSESSSLVKMYLSGDISQNVNDVNAYGASSFYAADRYISYISHWGKFYNDGYIIVATRYVSSNIIHQMTKLNKEYWDDFITWLKDFEHEKLGLPKPDKTIYLNISRDVANKLIEIRYNGDDSKKDIHEKDKEYLEKCVKSSLYVGKKENWDIINCSENGEVLPIEDIEILINKSVEEVLYDF
ncbi:MAG: dTMP kinase [Oscillospiraceae bacterium]